MKPSVLISSILISLSFTSYAQELHHSQLATHEGVYFEPKLVITMGESVRHATSTLKGDVGYGIGYDLGYSFGEYFALELDGTYTRSKVTETHSNGNSESDNASFYTYGTNAVFTYPLHNHLIILGKLGYGYEHEDLGELGFKGSEHGANWTAGVEYSYNPHIEISLEYEGSDIRSARGDSIQLGFIYLF